MTIYKPEFKCKYCDKPMTVTLANPQEGSLGACGCPESHNAWAAEHYAAIERRKVHNRGS